MNKIGSQMQQARINGDITSQDYDERREYLAQLGAVNQQRPPLPRSLYVKEIKTGIIHVWSEFFADRPDLCVNCDVNGNTDPEAWQSEGQFVIKTNTVQNQQKQYSGTFPGAVPQVNTAPAILGLPENFIQDYTEPVLTKEALPFAGIDNYAETVSDTVKNIFSKEIT